MVWSVPVRFTTASLYGGRDERDELNRQIATLRAVLAPLLDNPVDLQEGRECLFCGQRAYRLESAGHADHCPVLRRNELLGRVIDPEPASA